MNCQWLAQASTLAPVLPAETRALPDSLATCFAATLIEASGLASSAACRRLVHADHVACMPHFDAPHRMGVRFQQRLEPILVTNQCQVGVGQSRRRLVGARDDFLGRVVAPPRVASTTMCFIAPDAGTRVYPVASGHSLYVQVVGDLAEALYCAAEAVNEAAVRSRRL
jgi:hypothetical protein